ncbi:hypothetical protein QAD02_010127 [Eretmocerus hayati]|uniref:Uncharacterized protein n=1 Tax=Eretmocerus hayati TaxID=131215 RepID=A0ACC2NDP3_9HYME|nr:hypothetical protein QAD02_010127 [Eretmocerus hayati]
MERWSGKVAVVTGASAGIGLETAKALIKSGMIVFGLARRVEKMQNEMDAIKGPGKFFPLPCDVSKEADVIKAFETIENQHKTIHILINNAGLAIAGTIQDSKTEDLQKVVDVNIMGILHCTRQALKLMKKDQEGHIVNVNSNSGHRVPQSSGFNIYAATKHAVTALNQSLINELAGGKIRVTSISPGVVKTDFFDAAGLPAFLNDRLALNPEDIANSIIHAISAPPHVQIAELIIRPLGQIG